jgi:hypothetical protein
LAVYAGEQACCNFSPALIANLELYWDAEQKRACHAAATRARALSEQRQVVCV